MVGLPTPLAIAFWRSSRAPCPGRPAVLDQDVAETAWLARRAVELGQDDAVALCTGGFALADVAGPCEWTTATVPGPVAFHHPAEQGLREKMAWRDVLPNSLPRQRVVARRLA